MAERVLTQRRSRVEDLERDAVRVRSNAEVAQGTMMRATVRLVSKADYWPLTTGIRESRLAWWDLVVRCRTP